MPSPPSPATEAAENNVFISTPATLRRAQGHPRGAISTFAGKGSLEVSGTVIDEAFPGIFTLDSSGFGPGAILNEDATLNGSLNPAPLGSIVVLFATGEGETDPPGVDGKIATDVLPKPLLPVEVLIAGQSADILFAGGAPGLVAGVMQVNARVPADLRSAGAVNERLDVGHWQSRQVTVVVGE